jgi:hypothetical protein
MATRMRPSASSVKPDHRETTVCYAYMCAYAHGCTERTARPAQVLRRRCMRYLPESMRVQPGLSDFAIDLLARQRQRGEPLSPATAGLLDQIRPLRR